MSHTPKYISCMKLNGQPLLAPLMTEDRREQCLMYQAKAIACERRIDRNRFLHKCSQDLEELQKRTEQMRSRTSLEGQLTTLESKPVSLTRETIDVTEYSKDGVKIITKTTPPKLIRSNSYTLDTPSPILLAHMEREAQKSSNAECSDSSHDYDVTETDITIKSVTISSASHHEDLFNTYFGDILSNLPDDTAKTIVDLMENKQKPQEPIKEQMTVDRAAHKIGAWTRGYLIRRLMRTERIQNLIETIKDALLCAIQLHSAEVIEEADVELHRRLIQQVSAACYAFHDIFFTLSTKERMEIIANDREKRLETIKKNKGLDTMTHMIHMDESQIAR